MTVRRIVHGFVSLLAIAAFTGACGGRGEHADGPSQKLPAGMETKGAVKPLPDSAFKVEWANNTVPSTMRPAEKMVVFVTFKNISTVTWQDSTSTGALPPGAGAVRLAFRWWAAGSPVPTSYSDRIDLGAPLHTGESRTLPITLIAPGVPGDATLQIDLVQELVTWFGEKGAAQLRIPVAIR